jgi:peptidoglycan/LPS O-acetylase OafA/YrhL
LITGLLIDFLRGQVDIRRFYTRRVFKIIPHYYGLILLVFLVESLFLRHDPGKMVRLYAGDLVFLQNYIPSPAVILHTWSLVIEEQFYIFWAGFLWVIARWVRTPEGRMRWAVSVGVALVVLVNAYRYYFYQTNVIFLRPERFVHPTQMSTLRMDALMAGCLLRLALPKIDQWKLGQAWPWLLYALGISAFVFLLASPMKEFGSLAYWYLWMLTWIGPLLLIMSGVKGCFIVSGNRLLQWVGKSSYGIYLVHYPLLTALSWAVDRLSINRAIVPPFFLVASVLVGWATTQTLEKYFLNLRKRIAP